MLTGYHEWYVEKRDVSGNDKQNLDKGWFGGPNQLNLGAEGQQIVISLDINEREAPNVQSVLLTCRARPAAVTRA